MSWLFTSISFFEKFSAAPGVDVDDVNKSIQS
jgi:hypothetical protein